MNIRLKAVIVLFAISILWGFSFIPTSYLVRNGFSSSQLLLYRFLQGAIVLALVNYKTVFKISKNDIKYGVIIGLCVGFGVFLQNISMAYTSASKSSFLSASCIVLIPFLAYILNKTAITKKNVVGLSVAFIGMCFLFFNPEAFNEINFGDVLASISALGFGLQVVLLKKYSKKINAINVAFMQTLVMGILGLVLCIVNQEKILLLDNNAYILPVLYLGIIAAGVCYLGQTYASEHTSEVLSSILISSQAIYTVLFDMLFFNTQLTITMIIGIILMSISVVYLTLNKKIIKRFINKLTSNK